MKIDASKVQSFAFAVADLGTVVFPVSAPFVSAIEKFIIAAESNGLVPYMMTTEQAAAMAAGIAAMKSSAVTTQLEKEKKK